MLKMYVLKHVLLRYLTSDRVFGASALMVLCDIWPERICGNAVSSGAEGSQHQHNVRHRSDGGLPHLLTNFDKDFGPLLMESIFDVAHGNVL